MASNALAKKSAELEAARAGRRSAIASARRSGEAALGRVQQRFRAFKSAERTRTVAGMALGTVGAVGAGQLAKINLFPDAQGVTRAPWVSYAAGGLAFLAVITNRAKSDTAMAAVALGNGMFGGQMAIKSYLEWDLWPFDNVSP